MGAVGSYKAKGTLPRWTPRTPYHLEFPIHAPANCSGVNRNVIARTKPNPNPIPYPILNLKVNHYEDVKPFLTEILSLEQLSPEQMSDHQSIIILKHNIFTV